RSSDLSQMKDALLERTNVKIKANTHKEEFVANGEVVKFDGFLKVYLEGIDDEDVPEEQEGMLPALKVGESLWNNYITATQRFSRPPFRYAEASLVKKLEELGIRSEEHTSELQSRENLVCRLLLEKK